jgi:O-antigen ligase
VTGSHTNSLLTPGKMAGAFGIAFGFFAGTGVTGLSMAAGIIGLWALFYGVGSPTRPLFGAIKRGLTNNWLVWLMLLAFSSWVMITALWSPADTLAAESVRRILAMTILAPLAIWGCLRSVPANIDVAHKSLLAGLGIALFILVFETLSRGAINKIASPEKDPLAIAGDLGRAASATLALFWAGFELLKRFYASPRLHFGFAIICGFIAFQFGTDLNVVGLVLGSIAAWIASGFPRFALGSLSAGCALIVLSAPLLYPFITKIATAIIPGGELPLSYARRAQMWQVSSDLIAQKPLTGWGLGAGSVFDRPISYGGFEWPLIQLHPHAAPLHVWLETGAVGAVLASLTILAAGFAAATAFHRQKAALSALVGGTTFIAINWAFSHAAWREWVWVSLAAVILYALLLRGKRRSNDVGFGELS